MYTPSFVKIGREGYIVFAEPDACGVVHYASIDRATGDDARSGWRADFTSGDMMDVLADQGFTLIEDFYDPDISEANSSVVIWRA